MIKFKALLGVAILCVVAAFTAASADRYFFRRAAAAVSERVEGLSFAKISTDPWRSEGRIDGIRWRREGASLVVGSWKFAATPFFPVFGAAIAGIGAASAEDVTLEVGPSVYRIKRIDLSGAAISSAELMEILDPKSGAPIAERLARISAATIAIPEMTVESKIGTAAQTFLYRDILLAGIKEGRAGAASVAGISFSIRNAETDDADGAYGRVVAKDLDLVLAAKIASETRNQSDAPKATLVDAVDIDNFHIGGAHVDLDVKRLSAAAVTGRAPLVSWRETIAALPSARSARRNPLLAAFIDCFGSGRMQAEEIRLDARKDAKPVTLAIEQASVSGLDGPRIDAIESQNVAFASSSGKVGLKTLTLRGVDLAPLMSVDRAPNLLGKDLRPDFQQIALTGLEARPAPAENADAADGSGFEVQGFMIENAEPKGSGGSRLNVSLDHFSAPVSAEGSFAILSPMGYSSIDLSSHLTVIWSESSSELAINSLALNAAGMGSLDLAADFSNVTLDIASKDEQAAAVAAHKVLIKKLDLHVENAGLFDKALALQAKNDNQSIDDARRSDIAKADLLLPALLGNDPAARALGSAVAEFIAAPKTFTLNALAPDGIGISDLELAENPSALLKKIEIKAVANQ